MATGSRLLPKRDRGVQRLYEEYWQSRDFEFNPGGVRTVCCILGPYRNLTTLLSGLFALHPHCQVLNHAAIRILPLAETNFFADPTVLDEFIRYAVYLSQYGKQGDRGGSITLDPAFQGKALADTYAARYGNELLKGDVRTLLWKDSQRLTNAIHGDEPGFQTLIETQDRLRFLFPVRNPMDCALSNLKTQHGALIPGLEAWSVEAILGGILRQLSWFLSWQQKYPDRFFSFMEDEIGPALFKKLADFLSLPHDHRWVDDACACASVTKHYQYGDELLSAYRKGVELHLEAFPAMQEKLLRFASTV